MRLELATQNDFDAIIAFYDDVTERTPEMATYARWSKGKHPTVEGIRAYIDEGSMYLYRESGAIVGAMGPTFISLNLNNEWNNMSNYVRTFRI